MARWNYKDISYDEIDIDLIKGNDFLFRVVSIASFIEITSDIYESNLVDFYKDDKDISSWLRDSWEPEEIQHGKALREYIQRVWSNFDWERAYNGFRKEYSKLCTIDEFQPTKAKEMLARMVVETGTSTFYRGLREYANSINEPILAKIANYIYKDELYHYEEFYSGFKKYNQKECLGRKEIIKVIYQRLKMANDEDIFIAHKYIAPNEDFDAFKAKTKSFAKEFYPYNMAIKMLMQPLKLNRYLEDITAKTIQKSLHILGV